MIFFDFLFYRICKFYAGFKEKGAESSSTGIVGGLQALNLLTINMLILVIRMNNAKINVYFVIAFF